MSLTNVQRTVQVLPESLWNSFFPNALPVYTYENFLKAVAKFPRFCDDAINDVESELLNNCKIELATFLAHLKHESGTLIYVEEIGCSETGGGCDYSVPHTIYPPTPGKKYYGRGPFQLSYNYNYAQFSTVAFDGGLNDI